MWTQRWQSRMLNLTRQVQLSDVAEAKNLGLEITSTMRKIHEKYMEITSKLVVHVVVFSSDDLHFARIETEGRRLCIEGSWKRWQLLTILIFIPRPPLCHRPSLNVCSSDLDDVFSSSGSGINMDQPPTSHEIWPGMQEFLVELMAKSLNRCCS